MVEVIAEAGVNHNGSMEMALELVDAAAAARADVVKFQIFTTEECISTAAPKADYQVVQTGGAESQLEMVRKLELPPAAFRTLNERCVAKGIEFLATPFDFASLRFLVDELDVPKLKIASGEITNGPLMLEIARSGKPIILSTGMCTLGDVEQALGVLAFGYLAPSTAPSVDAFREAYVSADGQRVLAERVTLLHCTTEYPAPMNTVNLRSMETMRQAFGLPVGYSDHTQGIEVPVAAVALGATVIEKHFTLDRTLPGPDHAASLEPAELDAMVRAIRNIELALGSERKMPTAPEQKNAVIARRSLVARMPIRQGETFTADNLAIKRPGTGVSPMDYWTWLGRTADRDFAQDEVIG